MHKHFYLYLLLLSLVVAQCTPVKKELKKVEYKTVVTLVKMDTFPQAIHSVEHFNAQGKITERLTFYEREIIKWRFEKYTYNALNQLVKLEWKFPPLYNFEYKSIKRYNNRGLLMKRYVNDVYSEYNLDYYYDKSNKLMKIVGFNKKDDASDWKQDLIYNSLDSLTRVETVYWKDKEITTSDSIVYGANKKISYRLIDGEILKKNVTIYFNNKVMEELLYSGEPTKDEKTLQIASRTKYFYKGDRLIKKVVTNISSSEWCPIDGNGRTETFTYFYE